MSFLQKMKGDGQSPPAVGLVEVMWSWLGSFVGIGAVSLIHFKILNQTDLMMVIGSFGASAVLIYGAIRSPLAQPRNLIGGHILSAIIGVTAFQLFGGQPWLAAAIAVSTSIALMHLTKTLHPPGGATALIAVIGSDGIHSLGYLYVLIPVALGACIMLMIALIINNIPKNRRYPEFWM
jgi:CBS-domain-containing membrane protein